MKRRTVVVVRRPRGRPPRAMPGRPKTCPDGHPGKLILWGRRDWASAPFRRQRMRCVPVDGTKPHTFSLPRRQNTPDHPHGEDCSVCDVRPSPTQGPLSLVDFFHTAGEIARLLQLVGRGTSLRRSSLTVRIEAQKFVEDESGMRHASRQHVLAARYLDLFGAEIDRELAPRQWPRILVLDSKPFGLRAYGAAELGERWDPNSRAGAVLVAAGGNDRTRKPKAWRVGFAGDETAGSWLDFLNELEGDPTWVVADGSKAIRKAVRKRWPKATFYSCEFHLGKALADAALRAGIWPADPAHASLFERAFWSEADWNALATFALDGGEPELLRWVVDNDALVRRQVKLRKQFFGYPRSNGAAEQICDVIDRQFGRRRRYSLRNAKRLGLVFALLRAEQAGQVDLATYAAIVKRKLLALDGPFHFDWQVLEDPVNRLCSIARLLIGARDRGRRDTAAYMADAKIRSVLRLLGEENEARAAVGLAPLVASARPGRRTLSVDVAGLLLERDFPRLARDWDRAANDRDRATITAGSGYEAHWQCHRCGHTWVAPVDQRTKRLTRCARCHTERADGLNSVAAVHPGLVAEWDHEANTPLRPERIKATYDRTVVWRCLADPGHPPYRMSPRTRGKTEIGCPIDRHMARAALARRGKLAA